MPEMKFELPNPWQTYFFFWSNRAPEAFYPLSRGAKRKEKKRKEKRKESERKTHINTFSKLLLGVWTRKK